jgi:IS5 family transposase
MSFCHEETADAVERGAVGTGGADAAPTQATAGQSGPTLGIEPGVQRIGIIGGVGERQRLQKRGIELIAPYRENRKQRRYEDGRTLRRYKRRWIVERTNSWLGQFRRLLVRHEHLLSTYRAFFYLACFWITLRHCL